mmetsp:Transcript_44691/g.117161  ORF Transcript_44691/g.117161 Transcript_44691/m.117161 type:complete len:202 (+) Transcript_44691:195-800(+)
MILNRILFHRTTPLAMHGAVTDSRGSVCPAALQHASFVLVYAVVGRRQRVDEDGALILLLTCGRALMGLDLICDPAACGDCELLPVLNLTERGSVLVVAPVLLEALCEAPLAIAKDREEHTRELLELGKCRARQLQQPTCTHCARAVGPPVARGVTGRLGGTTEVHRVKESAFTYPRNLCERRAPGHYPRWDVRWWREGAG